MSRKRKHRNSAPSGSPAGRGAGSSSRSSRLLREPLPAALIFVATCFFLSGAAALTLEVVWSRSLRLVFGSTTLAISTVLVAYMLGLGLGGLAGGRIAGRLRSGVRVYGWIEIAIGVYALFVPWILGLLPALDVALVAGPGFWATALVRFVAVLLVLLLPTVLMGATLPILVAAVARRHDAIGNHVGLLYGINTLGAVTGVLGATFFLFPAIGLWHTNLVGALAAIAVGVVALGIVAPRLDREAAAAAEPTPAESDPAAAAAPLTGRARWNPLLLSYGVVGFTALAYEVCWTRALAMVLGSSIYAFATMLAAFLTGIALGSLFARRWCDGLRRPQVAYAVGVGVLGAGALATILAFGELPRIFVQLIDIVGVTPGGVLAANVGISMLAMLAPTLVLGALFPLLLRALSEDGQETSRTVGDVYFVNTVGCALGAFAAGFVLIPGLGLQWTMSALVVLNLATATALLLWQQQWVGNGRRVLAGAAAIAAGAVLAAPPTWRPHELNRGVYQLLVDADEWRVEFEPMLGVEPDAILMYHEGINTTVSVERREGSLVLRVNGKPDASSVGDMPTQVLLGQVPLLFGPDAERLMVIGLASGVTIGSAALHEPAEIDVVELEPAMVEASRYFDHVNYRPLEREGTRVIVDDGRVHLARRPAPYDVIISEPSNPWISGVANLFTAEFFRAAREALKPDGRLLQWVQLYGLETDAWASILAAIQTEFPYLYVFTNSGNSADSLVLASATRLGAGDFPRWEDLSEAIRDDLRRVGTFSTVDLWSLLRLGPEEVAELASAAPVVNTDDNMYVELTAPMALHDGSALDAIHERMDAFNAGALPHLRAAGISLRDDEVGELALAYATRRQAHAVARRLLADRPAEDPYVLTLEALLLAERAESEAERATAREQIQRATAQRPDIPSLLWHRANIFYRFEEFDAALADLDAFLVAEPDHVLARAQRLRVLFDLGRMQEVREVAEPLMATRYVEYDWDMLPLAATAAAILGDYATAIAEARRYLAVHPDNQLAWQLLRNFYEDAGEEALAQEARDNLERAQRNASREQYIFAIRLERLGELELAADTLSSALEEMPDFALAQEALRRVARKLDSPDI